MNLEAIKSADSQLYKSQVAGQAIVNDVLDNMYNDPFWAELLDNYAKDQTRKDDTIRIGFNSGILSRLKEEMVNFFICLPFLLWLSYNLYNVLSK